MRVLLADDDQSTREIIAIALEGDGHQLVICDDGSAAANALSKQDSVFDMLITDVEMPGMGGAELANKARQLNPNVKVLIISGFAPELDKAHATVSGGAGKLLKPFTLNDLRDAMAIAAK
ncbi:MAG: response regulator [Pseudomonadota bacterium]